MPTLPTGWLRRAIPAQGRSLHQAVLQHFATTGTAPALPHLAAALGLDEAQVLARLEALSAAGVVQVSPQGAILSAYPFSAAPTPQRALLPNGAQVYALCAVDALGLPAMLGGAVQIESACRHCGQPILVQAEGEQVTAAPPETVVWYQDSGGPRIGLECCAVIAFFCSRAHADLAHPPARADGAEGEALVISLEEAAAWGRGVFGGLLDRRLILLASANSYRTRPFLEAAARLNIEVVKGVDAPAPLPGFWPGPLPLNFRDPRKSARRIVDYVAENPAGQVAILPVDDAGTVIAARASAELGLPHNSPEAALAARDKFRMRQLLAAAGLPSPNFARCRTTADPAELAAQVSYPCVLKPLYLSGSRGVMRADNPAEFVAAFERLQRILAPTGSTEFLVEDFIPGTEFALEGLLTGGVLKVLALFDKPDPLDGPFFEETIYLTPSRLPAAAQAAIADSAARAAAALGLSEGPVHAELRLNQAGPWVIEIAGRSIGGLCSKTMRFTSDATEEELILRHAFGLGVAAYSRENQAGGVMMIPIPERGIFQGLNNQEAAQAVPGIESIEITARANYPIVPLPEGDAYLGFIFARGDTPAQVEAALREAHARLRVVILPEIMVLRGQPAA